MPCEGGTLHPDDEPYTLNPEQAPVPGEVELEASTLTALTELRLDGAPPAQVSSFHPDPYALNPKP